MDLALLFERFRHLKMYPPMLKRSAGLKFKPGLKALVFVGLPIFLAVSIIPWAFAVPAPPSIHGLPPGPPASPAAHAMPVFKLVEGAKGSPDPYTPRVLNIPSGRNVVLEITDHIGGCALVTIFPGLGVHGGMVRARVPVGQTRRVVIRAAKPGQYRYHCSGSMYFGEIVAH